MDPRNDPSLLPHGPPTRQGPPPPADARRAISMDQDYRSIMTARPRRSEPPPPYRSDDPRYRGPRPTRAEPSTSAPSRTDAPGAPTTSSPADPSAAPEPLPGYSSSIDLEGIFMKKHEIEDTTRRAEDRRWHATYVTLTGTALNLYKAKKNRTWGRTPQDGPKISPDNPPWMRKGKLEKSYSLLYADAGIAADYKKRRYVIRVRAETDQFLLSCIELSTFNQWLEAFFAAIDLALPIDDRDFPRDMSIPRVQRVRWYRLPSPARQPEAPSTSQQDGNGNGDDDDNDATPDAAPDAEQDATPGRRTLRRRSSVPAPLPSLYEHDELSRVAPDADEHGPRRGRQAALAIEGEEEDDDDDDDDDDQAVDEHPPAADDERSPPRLDPSRRLSSSSYHNDGVDPHSGKWVPEHRWSSAHDLLYAKLCYSNLLFRSPRKSNFIIRQGKKWFVDWSTGRMVRVLPPAYGEVEFFGPWQVVHTENMRI